MPNGPQTWCFTCNNYSEDDETSIARVSEGSRISYVIYGREVGTSGTPHLQGYVQFSKQTSMRTALKVLGIQAHMSPTRSPARALEYCKKEGNWVEFGTPPTFNSEGTTSGTRNDLTPFKEAVKAGNRNKKDLREQFSEVAARHPRFFEQYILDNRPKPPVETHPLRPWQENLYNLLKHKPNNRQIVFVVDEVGDQGKSWFADYYEMLHEDRTQIIIPGKKADMAYAVDEEKSVFFFDCPRSKQGDFIQYDFLEELKNGRIFSPKYESGIKRFPKKPHVIVLMNEFPDDSKLSKDRYLIYEIREDGNWQTH